jgi:type I restriction-modification system DNA methylase subunit
MEEIEEFHYSDNRDERVKETGEVFTPDTLVQSMLDGLDVDWSNPPQDKIFLDPTCGSGNFLVVLAERGILVNNIYGVDLMPDNIETTKRRLREIFLEKGMSEEDINFHLDRNIVCANALTYHYEFWWHSNSIIDDDW